MGFRAVVSKKNKLDSTANFILKINKILIKTFGKPTRNLNSHPVDVLVATILSQNTNDINSHKAFLRFKAKFPEYENILYANLKSIENTIRIAGLAKQKSQTIKNVLKKIFNEKGSFSFSFLNDIDTNEALNYLSSFKGVGLKTAACVLLFGLNKNVCPVDTHIHRILNRVGIVNTKDRNKTFKEINKFLPDGIAYEFHTNLIKLGRSICLSGNPLCYECPLLKICQYDKKNMNKKTLYKNQKEKTDFLLLDSI